MARQDQVFRGQLFQLVAPEAKKVLLVGDFTGWLEKPVPMRKGRDGVWTASVGLSPGSYCYLFMVDGQWQEDPECQTRLPSPLGVESMVRKVTYTA